MELTLWEINWRVQAIISRINVGRRWEMTLHGIAENTEGQQEDESTPEYGHDKLDRDQKLAMDIALKKAEERLTAKANRRN